MVKDEVRAIGFDDGPFTFEDETCPLAGVMTRGPGYVEGVLVGEVTVDGTDATDAVLELLAGTGFAETAQAVFVDGGTLAGFNVVDLDRLHDELGLPAVALTRERPDEAAVREALERHVDEPDRRARLLEKHPVHRVELDAGPCHVRQVGAEPERVAELVRVATVRGRVPEPLRIAHLVATAVGEGASRGA